MLKLLKRIVQDVTTSKDLTEALTLLVQRVLSSINTEAVAVYLIDNKQQEYVLIAAQGLNAKQKARIQINDGLVGLVGRREEPINIVDMTSHAEYKTHKSIEDKDFYAFIGVPIIQHRKLYGVLTAQQSIDNGEFDDTKEAFLITLAAQLGGIIAHADATGELLQLTKDTKNNENHQLILHGIGSNPGVAIGTSVVVYPIADLDVVPRYDLNDDEIDAEIESFYKALRSTRAIMLKLSNRMQPSLNSNEHALFDVYLRILDDDSLGDEVEAVIKQEKIGAQAALASVIKHHVAFFENIKDDYLKERASDFRDIGKRVLAQLQSAQYEEINYPKRTILVGEEITAADLAEIPENQLAGIVSMRGSHTSHVAIFAKAMRVPCVLGVRGLNIHQLVKKMMIVDSYDGNIFISPSKTLITEYKQIMQKEAELNESLISLHDKPAETLDNHKISLQVNTGLAIDSSMSMSIGAEGVGLYRSEVPFMSRDRFPSEDEQFIIYKQALNAFAPHPVTMRTLDIGGDKILPYFPMEEDNPYLGWRGIRVTLDHPDLFLLQVRAMMRANQESNNLRIMLPMVTTINEVDEASYLIDQAFNELLEEGWVIEKPKIGIMVEVPATALQAHEFSKRVDFLSVGSNDLTQYLLAVDRNNARVASLYDPLHPAMLTTLIRIIEGGHMAGIPVGLCGEMASDPLAVILLLAMGFDTLSMDSYSLLRIKWVIRSFSLAEARIILAEVLILETPKEIRSYLEQALINQGLGDLIRRETI
jgi:phosphotransferase system, enzyme I, PtsP